MKRQTAKFVRAFTLAELVIVMALLSIVSLLIVSFSSLTSAYSIRIDKNLASVNDVSELEEVFTIFLRCADTDAYTVYTSADGSILYISDSSDHIYSLTFMDGQLSGTTAVGGVVNFSLKTIESVTFRVENSSDGIGALVSMRIKYNFSRYGNKDNAKEMTYYRALHAANRTVEATK